MYNTKRDRIIRNNGRTSALTLKYWPGGQQRVTAEKV